jgi:hypothetical protein
MLVGAKVVLPALGERQGVIDVEGGMVNGSLDFWSQGGRSIAAELDFS